MIYILLYTSTLLWTKSALANMHLTTINDKIRETVLGIDYRGHLPADLLFHYDHVAKYAQKYYDAYRPQITELDQTFTSVAKALVLVLITQHYVLPAWRQLWAVGPIGSLVAVYTTIRDVSLRFRDITLCVRVC